MLNFDYKTLLVNVSVGCWLLWFVMLIGLQVKIIVCSHMCYVAMASTVLHIIIVKDQKGQALALCVLVCNKIGLI